MQAWIDSLIRGWGQDPATWPWTQFVYLAFMGLFAFIVINFAAISAGIFSWAERRGAGRLQNPGGPHPRGPLPLLPRVPAAAEMLLQEDPRPAAGRAGALPPAPPLLVVVVVL